MLFPHAAAPARRSRRIGPAAALLIAFSIAGCGKKPDKGPPPTPEVGYVVVQTSNVPLTIELAGRTAAYETSEVRPQVNGLIKSRLFEEGALVRKGQTLYQIDPRLYVAAADQAVAKSPEARRPVSRPRR